MVIESVTLKNYRQYRKKTTIELGVSANKNVSVIIGSNGAGKTNLSNAIQWCFYGKEPSLKEGVGFGILNMVEFAALAEEATTAVEVEVIISHNGERYSITRTKIITKINGNQEVVHQPGEEPDGSKLKAYFHGTVKTKPSLDPDFPATLINILAPEKISEYFFFDGEKLDKYFTNSPKARIQESIFQISQLDLLEKIVTRLNNVIRDYRLEARGVMPELDKIQKEITAIEKQSEDNKQGKDDEERILYDLKEQKANLLKKYAELGGENAKKNLRRVKELEGALEDKRDELEVKESEKLDHIIKNAYLFYAKDAFEYSLNLFSDGRKKGLFPPNIDPGFVRELLEGGNCICRADISENNPNREPRKHVKELFEKISTGLASKAGELLEKQKDISYIKDSKLKFSLETMRSMNKAIIEYNLGIDKLEKDLKNIKSKIVTGAELEKIENFESSINTLEQEIEKSIGKRAVLVAKKEELDSQLKKQKEEFENQAQKGKRGQEINDLINFCEEAAKCAAAIESTILNEIRQEMSKETEEHYRELHREKEEKIDIVINEDYKIFALQNDHDKFGSFAAGERALLAMSFLIALNHVSGFNVPIIMDTALGRISTGPRKQFSQNIARYLKDDQIILLFTESEFSPEVRSNLKPFINRQYIIEICTPLEVNIKAKND